MQANSLIPFVDDDIKNYREEEENKEYGACEFVFKGFRIKSRIAKITLKKVGQFVAFYKRIGTEPIAPYENIDPFDILMVTVLQNESCGIFVFPKKVLVDKRILSIDQKEGKRAFRVYPPDAVCTNKQAKYTQNWQSRCFLDLTLDLGKNREKIEKFLSLGDKNS